jgi:hypothetical protein
MRMNENLKKPTQPVDRVNYSNSRIVEDFVSKQPVQKVSSTFGESLPVLASFVKMYGKSFANAKSNY